MVCRDGMATMTHRTTFALDEATAQGIRSLAASWKVSQAEVVRRVVSLADMPAAKLDPVAMLLKLHQEGGGLTAAVADSYLAEIREDRKQWRGK